MFRHVLLVLIGCLFLAACMPKIPEHTKLYEPGVTVVAETVDIGGQTVYKDQRLTPYMIEGVKAYCSELYSTDLHAYRCFSGSNGLLDHGMDPLTGEWHKLQAGIRTKTIADK